MRGRAFKKYYRNFAKIRINIVKYGRIKSYMGKTIDIKGAGSGIIIEMARDAKLKT